jgi:hypothetical protein
MQISVSCQECRTSVRARLDDQGAVLSCPKCRAQVPIPNVGGQCPNCGESLRLLGRRAWFVLPFLLACPFGAISMIAVVNGEKLNSICMTFLALVVSTGFLAIYYIRQWKLRCPACRTCVVTRGLDWADEVLPRDSCPRCGEQMTVANARYWSRDVIVGLAAPLIAILGYAAAYSAQEKIGYLDGFVKAFISDSGRGFGFLFVACASAPFILLAYRSLRSRHTTCHKCHIRATVTNQSGTTAVKNCDRSASA